MVYKRSYVSGSNGDQKRLANKVRHNVDWLSDVDSFEPWFPSVERLIDETTDETALALLEDHLVVENEDDNGEVH